MGGRSGSSGMSSRGARSAANVGNMTRDERTQFLENAPVGTKISGLVSIRTGQEVHVEKEQGYETVRGGVGAGSRVLKTYWTVEGAEDPYISRTLRTAAEGTNKYYQIK